MIRIRSEHAIGFLKGRFQSLKGLRITIINEATHKFATYWIVACIGLHAYAMKCEEEERAKARGSDTEDSAVDIFNSDNDFIQEGISDNQRGGGFSYKPPPGQHRGSAKLAAGKARREHLRKVLLEAREEHAARRAARNRRRRQRGQSIESSQSDSD